MNLVVFAVVDELREVRAVCQMVIVVEQEAELQVLRVAAEFRVASDLLTVQAVCQRVDVEQRDAEPGPVPRMEFRFHLPSRDEVEVWLPPDYRPRRVLVPLERRVWVVEPRQDLSRALQRMRLSVEPLLFVSAQQRQPPALKNQGPVPDRHRDPETLRWHC